MNQNPNQDLHPLLGRWNVEHRFALMLQDGGILFSEKKYIWEFLPDSILIEQLPHHMPIETHYRYDPDSMLLSIDRPLYNDDDVDPAKPVRLNLKDHYRMEFSGDGRCILTMFDGNGLEPLNCSIRLLMKRVGKENL